MFTERLTLRQISVSDEQEIFTLRSDTGINRYLNRQVSRSLNDARHFISMIDENICRNESLYWAVILSEGNKFVGTCCLFSFSDENSSCEIGFELLPNFQGQGIMQEALKKVIE